MPAPPDDICPRPDFPPPPPTQPLVPPLQLAAVYKCESPQQANSLLGGEMPGYVYSRDGHPAADLLAAKCRELHGTERASICGTGMAALALALVSQLRSGDHIILGSRLYGKTLGLLAEEAARWGLQSTVVDTCDLAATAKAVTPRTKVLLAETITNPLLRVSDIAALAEIAHRRGAVLLIDNTFASPVVCRPVELGADLVMESLTKIMNGHSDVNLGLLCGPASLWERVPNALSTWGLTAAPFDCWLAARGLATLAVRAERACQNALHIARFLQQQRVQAVHYPGLEGHPDHALAARQFGNLFGHVVTFTLPGGQAAAEAFITGAQQVPFCPSLGDVSTTLSHPLSTSHRKLSAQEREAQGIFGGTIRLSIGIESADAIVAAIQKGLAAAERIS